MVQAGKETLADELKIRPCCEFLDTPFFVLRSPLLPVDELLSWSAGLKASAALLPGNDRNSLEQAWKADVEVLRERLRQALARPEIAHALFIASSSLEPGIEHWSRDPDSKKGVQAERALVRYFTRMCTRPTPFGLFSGCSLGQWDHSTDSGSVLSLRPREQYRVHVRLDFDYLDELVGNLRRSAEPAKNLPYCLNSSLHLSGSCWRYTAPISGACAREYANREIEDSPRLRRVIELARGAITAPALASAVACAEGTDVEAAQSYVHELIERSLLIPDFAPPLTGDSPLDQVIAQAETLALNGRAMDTLRSTREALAELGREGLRAAPAQYRSIASRLETLRDTANPAQMYQVDMMKPVQEAKLSKEVINELIQGLEVLRRLSPRSEPDELRSFRAAFARRYDRAAVPLLQALDEETGVGFGSNNENSPLIHGLPVNDSSFPGSTTAPNPRVLARVIECLRDSQTVLELSVSDLPADGLSAMLPDSFAVIATLMAKSGQALHEGNFQLKLSGVWGPDGVRYLARFCHADPELARYVREHLRQEEACDPGAVFAEIVHQPKGRMGSIVNRPVLRGYELVHLGRSGALPQQQITAGDLLLSIENSRFVLYSRTLRRRIVPRLTSAHGYMDPQSDPVYRFLCLLQRQGGTRIGSFSWGALGALEFLPRVQMGRLILAAAQWRLTRSEIQELSALQQSGLFAGVQRLRLRRGLPRWVVLQEADHLLPVDLENALSVDAFVHVLKRLQQAIVQEMLPPPDGLCLTGPEGNYAHEICVPFVRKRVTAELRKDVAGAAWTMPAASANHAKAIRRSLPPGSEWLYLKLYGGASILDTLLKQALPRLLAGIPSGLVQRWFFLRFADPDPHLRLRFQADPVRLRQELLPLVNSAFNPMLSQEGSIWKIQFDTYEREIERYGGPEAMPEAEEVFFRDSEAVLEILQSCQTSEAPDQRWQAALFGVDALLCDFNFDLHDRRDLVKRLRDKYQDEFAAGEGLKRALAEKFRLNKAPLEALWSDGPVDPAVAIVRSAFQSRSRRLAEVAQRLHAMARRGCLGVEISGLLASFVHMHINRMIRSSQRKHEFVLYDFLLHLYEGRLARSNKNVQPECPV